MHSFSYTKVIQKEERVSFPDPRLCDRHIPCYVNKGNGCYGVVQATKVANVSLEVRVCDGDVATPADPACLFGGPLRGLPDQRHRRQRGRGQQERVQLLRWAGRGNQAGPGQKRG